MKTDVDVIRRAAAYGAEGWLRQVSVPGSPTMMGSALQKFSAKEYRFTPLATSAPILFHSHVVIVQITISGVMTLADVPCRQGVVCY